MKRNILIGLCLCLFNLLRAQDFRFGLSLNAASSKIQSNYPFPEDYLFLSKASGKFGLTVEKKLSKKSALGMELLWVIMEGQEYLSLGFVEVSLTSSGGVSHQEFIISDNTYIHGHYIGVPAYFRQSFGRLSIKGGLQALVLISMNLEKYQSKSGTFTAEQEPIYHFNDAEELRFRKYDLGPQIGIDFRVNDRYRMRVDYYQGLMNLYTGEGEWQRKNRQISFGIDYWFTPESH